MKFLLFDRDGNTVVTGNTTSGSAVVTTLTSTVGLKVGDSVNGSGIPLHTTVVSIDSSTQVTLSKAATATATGVTLTFYPLIISDGSQPVIAVFAASFGGGTVTIEYSPDGGTTWITPWDLKTLAAAAYTANTYTELFRAAAGHLIRAKLSGATAPSNLYVTLGG